MKKRVLKWLKGYIHKCREEEILKTCGCVCYCPNCKDILNDQADVEDDDFVYYHCNLCHADTIWTFDAIPGALFLRYGTKQEIIKV